MEGICAFDLETTKLPNAFPWNDGHRIVSIHFATSDKDVKSYVLDHDDMTSFVPRSKLIKEIQQMFDKYKIIVAHNCFSGDTKYLTPSGAKSFSDTVDTTQMVWSDGMWRQALISNYGRQSLVKLVVRPYNRSRSKITHTIYTTASHNWEISRVRVVSSGVRKRVPIDGFTTTANINIGDVIKGELPTYTIDEKSNGFKHGLIFGDGAKCYKRQAYQIRLCGSKGQYKDSFARYTYPKSASGDPVVNYYRSNTDLKSVPDNSFSNEYIANFIAGWAATDGTVRNTTTVINTVDGQSAKWLAANASRGGWYCTGITKHKYTGYSTSISTDSLDKYVWYVMLTKDVDMGWSVISVEDTDIMDDVYCAEVLDGTAKFTLDGGIYTGNCKFDLHQLRALGIDFSRNILYCTQVAEYLLNYQDKTIPLSLEETSKRYGITPKIDRVKTYWDAGVDTPSIPLDILIPYGEQDVINCLDIFYKQQPKIRELGMKQLFQVNMETIRVLEEMEWNGMLVDKDLMQKYSKEYGEKINELSCEFKLMLESKIPELAGIPYNLNSGDHLSVILYGGELKYDGKEQTERVLKDGTIKYGERNAKVSIKTAGLKFKPLPKTQTAKAGFYQTDVQTLVQLKCTNKTQDKALEYIRELSRLEKLRGTYFDGMQDYIASDGLIHQNLNQTVTVTGRLSCSKPNLQNISRGTTGPGKKVFVTRYVREPGET